MKLLLIALLCLFLSGCGEKKPDPYEETMKNLNQIRDIIKEMRDKEAINARGTNTNTVLKGKYSTEAE